MKRLKVYGLLCLAAVLAGCGAPADVRRQDGIDAPVETAAESARRTAATMMAHGLADEALSAHVAQGRERIAAERASVEQRFAEAERACWRKFAVNGCIDDARAARRQQVAELRQQELVLSELERRQQTADRLRQLEQKQQTAR